MLKHLTEMGGSFIVLVEVLLLVTSEATFGFPMPFSGSGGGGGGGVEGGGEEGGGGGGGGIKGKSYPLISIL